MRSTFLICLKQFFSANSESRLVILCFISTVKNVYALLSVSSNAGRL